MSTSKTLFSTTYAVPVRKERGWGVVMSNLVGVIVDALEGALHKYSGGNHTLKLSTASSSLASSATLTPTAAVHLVAGSGGAVTLDGTTAIADGEVTGAQLILIGTDGTNTVTVNDGANTVMAGNLTLGLGDSLTLIWDGSDWVETSRSNN